MNRAQSVVLLSGGLDSAANLALCSKQDEPVLALTVDYGQRAYKREFEAAQNLSQFYSVPHECIDLKWLGGISGRSALTSKDLPMPELKFEELDEMKRATETAAQVWVPNRNGVLFNLAAARAETLGAKRVVVGFNREEAATFPDNTQEFLEAMTSSLRYSTQNQVEAFSYTTELNKAEIVARLKDLQEPRFPFEMIWSCYEGNIEPCGVCESCQRLSRALGSGA